MQELLSMPNISGADTETQVAQMKSYLIQLKEQLEFALNSVSQDNASVNDVKENIEGLIDSVNQVNQGYYENRKDIEKVKGDIISTADIISSEDFVDAMKTTEDSIVNRVGNKYIAQTDDYAVADDLVSASVQEIRDTTMEQTKTNVNVTCSHEVVTNVNGNVTTSLVKPYIQLGLIGTDENGVEYYGLKIGQLEGVIKVKNGQYVVDENGNYVYDMKENPYTTETTKDGYRILENGIPIQWYNKNASHTIKQEIRDTLKIGNSANGMLNFVSMAGGVALKWSDA